MSRKVFITGPLFTSGQRAYLERIDELCTDFGFETYLPHRDAGLAERDEESSSPILSGDVEKLQESDLLVAVINGLEVDAGTAWLLGHGYANDIDTIGLLEDTRIFDQETQLNPMISGSVTETLESFDELRASLRRAQND